MNNTLVIHNRICRNTIGQPNVTPDNTTCTDNRTTTEDCSACVNHDPIFDCRMPFGTCNGLCNIQGPQRHTLVFFDMITDHSSLPYDDSCPMINSEGPPDLGRWVNINTSFTMGILRKEP